jgi:hypothetical protein
MVKNRFPLRQAAALALLLSVAAPERSAAAETRADPAAVVADWRTGLALYGFDPVAYFADGKPAAGLPELEGTTGALTWRFRNEGNRAAFEADPEAYLPRFGGHDPVALARGAVSAGNPLIWLVHDQRLYLFHDPAAQAAFAADPDMATAAAAARWPGLQAQARP